MLPTELIASSAINLVSLASSKKRALEEASFLLTCDGAPVTQDQVFERLLERERLGSTGLSGGIALPHARMANVERARGAFLRLAQGVDFDALDGQPVDLIFALMVPENATEEHLGLLAQLAKLFSDAEVCRQLRSTTDAEEALRILNGGGDGATPDSNTGSVRLPA